MAQQKQILIPKGMDTIATDLLKPHPKNVKVHTKQQVEAIAEAIKLLGIFKDPVIIDKTNLVWIGNGRLEAAILLEMPKVPYLYLDHLTQQQRKALMILDNKLTEMSKYNKENLITMLTDIKTFDFTPYHLEFEKYILKEITDEEPPPPRQTTKIKRGEVYTLGSHRLMCGDCTNQEDIQTLLQDKKVSSMVTDPPYGVDYGEKTQYLHDHHISNRQVRHSIANDKINNYREFFAKFIKLTPFSEYNTFYIFMSGQELHNLRLGIDDAQAKWGDYLIWKKQHFVMGRKDYNSGHEFIVYGWKGKHKFYGTTNSSTILEYDRNIVSKLHPTMKPVALLVALIQDGSKKKELVYDPFAGSGSTLMAAEQADRVCYSMEIDPIYCQVIIDRWEKFTNKKAVRVTGSAKEINE